MRRTNARLVLWLMLLGASAAAGMGGHAYPFVCLAPEAVEDAADRLRLDTGDAVVKILPSRDRQVAVTAVVRVNAAADRLAAWTERIERLQQGRYVPQIARFSNPPRIEDLDGVVLDDEDLDDIRRCRPGSCGVKLSDAEIRTLRQAAESGASWKTEVQRAFRQALLRRAQEYLTRGEAGIPPYHDDRKPVDPNAVFGLLVEHVESLPQQFPELAVYLREYPYAENAHVVDSFLYWSRETLGARPIIGVTHVALARYDGSHRPVTLAIARQIFATHYKNASLAITAIAGAAPDRYLVYVHRSHVDVLHGVLGGFVRKILERRVRAEAPAVVDGFRFRLEAGDPPPPAGNIPR